MVAANQKLIALLERTGANLPLSAEAMSFQVDYTFWAKSDKAKRELGWTLRPVQEVFQEILNYEMKKRGK